ncbi:MAG: hypothetical protein MPK31_01490 [Gammaproteobacteria bacterium]|nr:hypothetical protein [Gammaproteobacteria bacterium]MDA8003179.1 hypothetical protein [Alphaproteobacteria bacterium]
MAYIKKIVCLANSRKHGGFCFAEKEVLAEGTFGEWIRPVNAQNEDAISSEDMVLADGLCPQLLDVISIPLLEPMPKQHQKENHQIDVSQSWTKQSVLGKQELPKLLDSGFDTLWLNDPQFAKNDRIRTAKAHNLLGSLLLIQPESLNIIVQWKQPYTGGPPEVVADFRYNQCNYQLCVTDPLAEQKYRKMSMAEKKLGKELPRIYPAAADKICLCVSLGEEYHGFYYKLVAAIIGDPD